MQVYDSLSGLVGNTPLIRLRSVTRRTSGDGRARQGGVLQPGRLGQGPHRAADYRGRGGVRRAQARRHDRGTHLGEHRSGAGDSRGRRGYRCVFVCPDKVAQDKISVLRAYGAEVVVCPGTVAPDHPDSYYSVARRLAAETPGGWQPDQYANPETRPPTSPPPARRSGADRRDGDPLRGRHRHRGTITGTGRYLKEVSDGAVRVIGADPEGSVYSGGSGLPAPGRGRRRGHLARHLRPIGVR